MSSNPLLGFVLLTHQNPKQIIRLIDRLNFMFDQPPIVCHHDFGQCKLPLSSVPQNVSFVSPHVKTEWGKWSLVEATLKAIKQLYLAHDPDWFILLSGTDYPIKPGREILSDLRKTKFDAHISSKKLVREEIDNPLDAGHFVRYNSFVFEYPSIFHLVQSIRRRKWVTDRVRVKNPKFIRYLIPFSNDFKCYRGSQWFTASRKAANYILDFDASSKWVKNFYKRVDCPDESYFHIILNNDSDMKISTENWRYEDWAGMNAHPKELGAEDLKKMIESNCHFARKFNLRKKPDVLDRIDEIIGFKA